MSDHSTNVDAGGLHCPGCGYDLRGSEGRCPECGREFVKGALAVSRIPWLHRREIGRIKAWWRTVWMVLRRAGEVGAEVSRPVEWESAKRFGWVTAWMAGVAVWGLLMIAGPPARWRLMDDPFTTPSMIPMNALKDHPVMAVVLALSTVLGLGGIVWWMRAWMWITGGVRRDRASAIACYGCVWMAALCVLAAGDLAAQFQELVTITITWPVAMVLVMFFLGIHLAVLVAAPVGIVTMYRRCTGRGWLAAMASAVAIATGAVAVFSLVLMMVVYLAGLLALMWVSVWR